MPRPLRILLSETKQVFAAGGWPGVHGEKVGTTESVVSPFSHPDTDVRFVFRSTPQPAPESNF